MFKSDSLVFTEAARSLQSVKVGELPHSTGQAQDPADPQARTATSVSLLCPAPLPGPPHAVGARRVPCPLLVLLCQQAGWP